jgi:hypothetical protein
MTGEELDTIKAQEQSTFHGPAQWETQACQPQSIVPIQWN